MMHVAKSKPVVFLLAALALIGAVIGFEVFFEADAVAENINVSYPGYPPDPKIESYEIETSRPDVYEYRAGTVNQPASNVPKDGQVMIGRTIEHLTYEASPTVELLSGNIRITLDIHGQDFMAYVKDDEGNIIYDGDTPRTEPKNPLIELRKDADHPRPDTTTGGNVYVEIWDDLFDFIPRYFLDPNYDFESSPSGDPYIEITDLDSFFPLVYPAYELHYDKANNYMWWLITDSTAFTGAQPLAVSYILGLDTSRAPADILNPQPGEHFMLTNHDYVTGVAKGRFRPNDENSLYWKTEVVVTSSQNVSAPINWNNGNGMRQGTIYDPDTGFTMSFQQNRDTVAGRESYTAVPGNLLAHNPAALWNHDGSSVSQRNGPMTVTAALLDSDGKPMVTTIGGILQPALDNTKVRQLSWHVNWANTPRYVLDPFGDQIYVDGVALFGYPLIFSIQDLYTDWDYANNRPVEGAVRKDGSYMIVTATGGGNDYIYLMKIERSNEYIRILQDGEDQYNWVGDVLVSDLESYGLIRLVGDPPLASFDLTIKKNYYNEDEAYAINDVAQRDAFIAEKLNNARRWFMNADTIQTMRIKIDDDSTPPVYLSFAETRTAETDHFYYEFVGTTSGLHGSVIQFSQNKPAVLLGVPTMYSVGDLIDYQAIEDDLWAAYPAERRPEVAVTYVYDDHARNSTGKFDAMIVTEDGLELGENADLTVTNQFETGAFGNLQLRKLVLGSAADWGIDNLTPFPLKIWDPGGWNGMSDQNDPDGVPIPNPGGNYLLFRPRVEDPAHPEAYPFGYDPGTFYCTGNTGLAPNMTLAQYRAAYAAWQDDNPGKTLDDWRDTADPWFWSDREWQLAVLEGNPAIEDGAIQDVWLTIDLAVASFDRVILSNLWPGNYEVHEYLSDGVTRVDNASPSYWDVEMRYSLEAADGSGIVPPLADGHLRVDIVNSYQEKHDNLTLTKDFIGPAEMWGIDGDTPFTVRLLNEAHDRVLLFAPNNSIYNLHERFWDLVGTGDFADPYDEALQDRFDNWPADDSLVTHKIFIYNEGKYTTIYDLFSTYEANGYTGSIGVDEIDLEESWTIRMLLDGVDYDPNNPDAPRRVVVVNDGEGNATSIFNSFLNTGPRRGGLIKSLSGDYADYQVDYDTVFEAGGYNIETGRRLLFQEFDGENFVIKTYDIDITLSGKHYHHIGEVDERAQITDGSGTLIDNPDYGAVYVIPLANSLGSASAPGGVKDWRDEFVRYDSLDVLLADQGPGSWIWNNLLNPSLTHKLDSADKINFERWLEFSVNAPAQICRLLPTDYHIIERQKSDPDNPFLTARVIGAVYLDEPIDPDQHYGNSATMMTMALFINNHYDGTLSEAYNSDGQINIFKALAGDWRGWDVDSSTAFSSYVEAPSGRKVAMVQTGTNFAGPVYSYVGEELAAGVYVDSKGEPIALDKAIAALNTWYAPQTFTAADIITDVDIYGRFGAMVQVQNLPYGSYKVHEEMADDGRYDTFYAANFRPSNEVTLRQRLRFGTVGIVNIFAGPGDLLISKELTGAPADWSIETSTTFYAQIKNADGQALVFDTSISKTEGAYEYVGYIDGTGTNQYKAGYSPGEGQPTAVIEITAESSALITNLPAQTSANYTIEELNQGGLLDTVGSITYSQQTGEDFTLLQGGVITINHDQAHFVTITNDYLHKRSGELTLEKQLDGAWADMGITATTDFDFTLTNSDVASDGYGRTLLFEYLGDLPYTTAEGVQTRATYRFVGEVDGTDVYLLNYSASLPVSGSVTDAYYQLGNDAGPSGQLSAYPDYVTALPVSQAKPVQIVGLIPGSYTADEDVSAQDGSVFSYLVGGKAAGEQDLTVLADGGQETIVITNTWDGSWLFLGAGVLDITKSFGDTPDAVLDAHGVDDDTVFDIMLKNAATDNYLVFVDSGQTDISKGGAPIYLYVGEENAAKDIVESDGTTLVGSSGGGLDAFLDGLVSGLTSADLKYSIPITKALGASVEMLPDDGDTYVAEEVDALGAAKVSYVYGGQDAEEQTSITLPPENQMPTTIEVMNEYTRTADLIVEKTLAGRPGDWGVNANTAFSVRVIDNTGSFLQFVKGADASQAGKTMSTYQLVEPGTPLAVEWISVTPAKPTVLKGLQATSDISYTVEERGAISGQVVTYFISGNNITANGKGSVGSLAQFWNEYLTVTVNNWYPDKPVEKVEELPPTPQPPAPRPAPAPAPTPAPQPAPVMPGTGDWVNIGLLLALIAGSGSAAVYLSRKGKKGKGLGGEED